MSGSWQAERTRRLPREDPRAEVGEDVRVGVVVGVSPMEFKLIASQNWKGIVLTFTVTRRRRIFQFVKIL